MQPQPRPAAAPLALPCYAFLSTSSAFDPHSAKSEAQARGWEYLDNGAYSTVFLSPHRDRVLKVTPEDPGAVSMLRASLAYPANPHLPKILGYEEFGEGQVAVEMERLEPVDHGRHQDWLAEFGMGNHGPDLDDMPEGPMKEAIAAIAAEFDERIEEGWRMFWDCHSGNVMVRPSDGSLVLTDLVGGDRHHMENCDRCGVEEDAEELVFIDANHEQWCGDCFHHHAFLCEGCNEYCVKDEHEPDHVPVIDYVHHQWLAAAPIEVRESAICAVCKDDYLDHDDFTFVEDRNEFWRSHLKENLDAIQFVARDMLDRHIQPRLPLAA